MAKQTVNIGDTGQQLVDKLGNNFTELYSRILANEMNIAQLQAEATSKWIILNDVDNRTRALESTVGTLNDALQARLAGV